MGTMTAQVLVGNSHPNHGGINPSHYLFLSENSRPAWILVPQNIFPGGGRGKRDKVTWIPTLENMLEDALLMIGLYVLEDENLIELARQYFNDFESEHIALYDDISEGDRKRLYQECRKLDYDFKIVITTFDSKRFNFKVLEEYLMDVSVCTPDYRRWYSKWQDEVRTEGSLE
ncbi:hypothetical protein MWH25_08680 [Natroniella acetigena]|uniref:hypothetical protein n=1 Tax=Natroniella acetigena TaxID=52004 RepID=UPI00200A973A|nr:hypothetical protein [Natroniella acetigena]MCK8827814.1 hypothetical protein [Natroniella acetigena]